MENAQARIIEIIESSPLPSQMKTYYLKRLEQNGVNPAFVESIKSMLRSVEADAFGRMGYALDERSPDLMKASKLHSDAVQAAAEKYQAAAVQAANAIAAGNSKAAKGLESQTIKAKIQ